MGFCGRWWRVISDLVVLSILVALLVFLELAPERGLYVKRGFFCDDESLRYPFSLRPAVPIWLLVLGCVLVPLAAIFLGNLFEKFYRKRPECPRKRVSLCERENPRGTALADSHPLPGPVVRHWRRSHRGPD